MAVGPAARKPRYGQLTTNNYLTQNTQNTLKKIKKSVCSVYSVFIPAWLLDRLVDYTINNRTDGDGFQVLSILPDVVVDGSIVVYKGIIVIAIAEHSHHI